MTVIQDQDIDDNSIGIVNFVNGRIGVDCTPLIKDTDGKDTPWDGSTKNGPVSFFGGQVIRGRIHIAIGKHNPCVEECYFAKCFRTGQSTRIYLSELVSTFPEIKEGDTYKFGPAVVAGRDVVVEGSASFSVDVNSTKMLTVRKSGGTLNGQNNFDRIRQFS